MILLWKDKNYAKDYKLGSMVHGVTHESTRPDTVILTKKEYDKLIRNPDPVLYERGKKYMERLLRITSTPNVIVAQ